MLQVVGQRGANPGVILMVAGALNQCLPAIQKEAAIHIEGNRTHAEHSVIPVPRVAAGFHRSHCVIDVRFFRGPQRRMRELRGRRKTLLTVRGNFRGRRFGRSDRLSCSVQNLPAHAAAFRRSAAVLDDGAEL